MNIDETFPYAEKPNSFYGNAKKLAELEILNSQTQIKKIILRPPFIWGPGCPALKTIEDKIRGRQFIWIDRGSSPIETVHVDNVVHAIQLACCSEKGNGIYLVTDDEPITTRDFFSAVIQKRKIKGLESRRL